MQTLGSPTQNQQEPVLQSFVDNITIQKEFESEESGDFGDSCLENSVHSLEKNKEEIFSSNN